MINFDEACAIIRAIATPLEPVSVPLAEALIF